MLWPDRDSRGHVGRAAAVRRESLGKGGGQLGAAAAVSAALWTTDARPEWRDGLSATNIEGVPRTAIVLFTRDLRVHDNPALRAAHDSADYVVPLFVVDSGITTLDYNRPNRAKFLAESLADLDANLQQRGAGLVVRTGDVAKETAKLADQLDVREVHCAADYSR